MKAYLQSLIATETNPLIATHQIREYLQSRILQSFQRAGAMQTLAFHGGTSLRFLYNIPRYSEDLNFALSLQPEQYDFRSYLNQTIQDLAAETYDVSVKINEKQVVHKAFIRFRGLLYDLGLSGHQAEVLAIKIEVDTNPPPYARLAITPIQRHIFINIHHHDRASLLAGKLHAVLERTYIKGRDWYDLWWYLSQENWPLPNFDFLNSTLHQSGSTISGLNEQNWQTVLQERVEGLDWAAVWQDVEPFIIDNDSQKTFNKAKLLKLLKP